MKKQSLIATALTVSAFVLSGAVTLTAADAKAKQDVKPAKKPAAIKAAPAPKTLGEVLAFLPETIAEINGKKIIRKDVIAVFEKVPSEEISRMKPEMIKALATQAAQTLIDTEVMLELAKKAGIKPSKAMLLAELENQLKSVPKSHLDMLEKQLKLQNKTIASFKEEISSNPQAQKTAAIAKFVKNKIEPTVKVSDADIEKFYRENQNQFKSPESISASHILISVTDPTGKNKSEAAAIEKKNREAKDKAEKILARLKQGADFGAIAEKESDCNSKKQKGSLGEFHRGQMVPEFEKAAFDLAKPGDISGIVKTQFGYHIIRLDGKKPASVKPLSEVKEMIRGYLTNSKMQQAIQQTLAKAKKDMKIKVFMK